MPYDPPHTRSGFLRLLREAIETARSGEFEKTIARYRDIGSLALKDDGSFEKLCAENNYVVFIQQLVDCWIDSTLNPEDYPGVEASRWLSLARSLLEDIEKQRNPSHALWNEVFTLPCELCHRQTRLESGRFHCTDCDHVSTFHPG